MSSRGMSSGRETRRGGVRSGNGEFEFQGSFLMLEVGGFGEACGPSTAPPATGYHYNA